MGEPEEPQTEEVEEDTTADTAEEATMSADE